MKKNILLTGAPGVGKTTVIQRVAAAYGLACLAGFYTEEIRQQGQRKGFGIKTMAEQKAVLSHVDFRHGPAVGKYKVDLAAIDTVIVPSLRPAGRQPALIIIDEIGKMECLSPAFRKAVVAALDSPIAVLGSISKYGGGIISQIKSREDVLLLEVTRANRDGLPEKILSTLGRCGLRSPHHTL